MIGTFNDVVAIVCLPIGVVGTVISFYAIGRKWTYPYFSREFLFWGRIADWTTVIGGGCFGAGIVALWCSLG